MSGKRYIYGSNSRSLLLFSKFRSLLAKASALPTSRGADARLRNPETMKWGIGCRKTTRSEDKFERKAFSYFYLPY